MADQQFRAIITVLDRFSAPLRGMAKQLHAMNAPFKNLSGAIHAIGEESGIIRLGEQVERTMGKFEHLGAQIGGLLGPLAALGAVGSIAGLADLAKGAAEYGEQLGLASLKTGEGVSALARLHYIAQLTNVDTARLDKSLFKLNVTIADAFRGKNKDAAGLFAKMHISLRGLHGTVRDAASILPELADKFAHIANPAARAGFAAKFFGARMGADMIPMLVQGKAWLVRMGDEFDHLHGVVTEEGVAAAREGAEAWKRLTLATDGLKYAVGSALIPVLDKLIVPLTNLVAANRHLIATKVAKWADRIATALKAIDWKSVGTSVLAFGRAVKSVAISLGPMWTAIAAATVVLSPFIAATLSAGASLVRLGFAVGGVTVRLGMLALGGLVTGLSSLALSAGVAAEALGFEGLASAFVALGIAIEATPIGWIITGIAAVAGGAYLLWKYWKPITGWFKGQLAELGALFEGAWKRIKPIIDAFSNSGKWIWDHAALLSAIPVFGQGVGIARGAVDVVHRFAPASSPVISPRSGRGPGAPNDGKVHVQIDFNNLPRGVTVKATGSGPAVHTLDVGRRFATP